MIQAIRPYFAEGSLFDTCSTTVCQVITAIKEAVIHFFQMLCPSLFKQEEPARPMATEVPPPLQPRELIMNRLRDLITYLPEESQMVTRLDLMNWATRLTEFDQEALDAMEEKVAALHGWDPDLFAKLEQIFFGCETPESSDSVDVVESAAPFSQRVAQWFRRSDGGKYSSFE